MGDRPLRYLRNPHPCTLPPSLNLITLSELGDKTFFIGAILAMRHSRHWVLLGVVAALATMTVLSVRISEHVLTGFRRGLVHLIWCRDCAGDDVAGIEWRRSPVH